MNDQTQTAKRSVTNMEVAGEVAHLKSIDPGLGAYNFGDIGQAVQFADLMSRSGPFLPEFIQNKPALCLAVTMRALHWGFDPFALAQEAFQPNANAPVGFQGKVFAAVAAKNRITLKYAYEGEFRITNEPVKSARGNIINPRSAKGNRKCIVSAVIDGEELKYETPELDNVTIKNSPLWHNDPDQQLAYYGARGWMRRYRPDLMMGAYSDDEVREMRPMRDVTPQGSGFAQLAARAAEMKRAENSPSQADHGDTPSTSHEQDEQPSHEAHSEDTGETQPDPTNTTAHEDQDPPAEEQQDEPGQAYGPDDPAFVMGAQAAREGMFEIDQCPFKSNPEQEAAWRAGYESEKGGDA